MHDTPKWDSVWFSSVPPVQTSHQLPWQADCGFYFPSVHFSPQFSILPPETKDPQSGFDELVNPRLLIMMWAAYPPTSESLKGWSDGFVGPESEGADHQELVIGLIYPHSPWVSSSSAHQRHHSRSVWNGVWMVEGHIITLSIHHFPPVTHLNEARKTEQVCVYVVFSLWFCLSPPASLVHNLISDL